MSSARSRRGMPQGIMIFNASDDEQFVSYNGRIMLFPPGVETEVLGQLQHPKDEFDRPTEEGLVNNLLVPDKNSTAELIAEHISNKQRFKGLCRLFGDETDKPEIADVRNLWIKTRTKECKEVEARWRQKCLDSKAAGAGIPPMPEYVEKAQDFLIKYKHGTAEVHKRFVVTIDGRSFDTKAEAKRHIAQRYPSEAAEWAAMVNDTQYTEEEEAAEEEAGLEALAEIAAKSSAKKAKKS